MMQSFFQKTLYQKRWMTLAWALGCATMVGFTLMFYPSLKETNIASSLSKLPAEFSNLVGSLDSFNTVTGYIGQQLFNLRLTMLTVTLAITLFAGLTASDEDRGSTAEQLTLPISRSRLIFEKYAAAATILAVAHLAAIGGVLFVLHFIHESVSLVRLIEVTFAAWLLAMALGSFTFAVGASTGSRGISIGLAAYFTFQMYLITSLAPSVNSLQAVNKLSPFHYYNPGQVMQHGLIMHDTIILMVFITAFTLLGWLMFRRRDLNN